MDVFILKYDAHIVGSMAEEDVTSEVIGVYSTFEKASKAYNFYLDAVEKTWREEDGEAKTDNTFNRFSEPLDAIVTYSQCSRLDMKHSVFLLRMPLE